MVFSAPPGRVLDSWQAAMSDLHDDIRELIARIEQKSHQSKPPWHIAASKALWRRLKHTMSGLYPTRRVTQQNSDEVLPTELPIAARNELALMLSRIDQEIERAKAIIDSPRDKLCALQAEVTLAELENLRYEVEGKLGSFTTE